MSSESFDTVTRNSYRPLSFLIESKIGFTNLKNSFLTWSSFCSNNNLTETAEINFLALNNNLLTLILSKADSLTCNVLLPHIIVPVSENVAIGLSLFLYKLSLSSKVNFLFALIAFNKPFLAQPIGAGVTTVGIPLGMGVIIFTIVITGIYVNRANSEYDALTKEILEDATK